MLCVYACRQQAEFEALLQRGARGRDELELKRVAEIERRTNRWGWKEAHIHCMLSPR
jgi:hypothetical protein